METFQRLRKIYGDLECQYCGEMMKPPWLYMTLLFIIFLCLGWALNSLFLCCTGKLFWYKVHYNVHVRTHTKEHSHYCSKCSYSSITKSSLKRHQIQKHSGLLLPCSNPGCKYTTPDKYKLQAHLRTHQEQVSSPSPDLKNNLLKTSTAGYSWVHLLDVFMYLFSGEERDLPSLSAQLSRAQTETPHQNITPR